ncbi:translational GTPase TypA [Vulgatibacter sp.]|uniref:translational GTPase TypA n=1 Tax=Vulgatibacter sp. TaxID=1971226 RepID=UPI00356A90D6
MNREQLRNIAIVAHVDHGKTTLVDHMLRQAGTFRANEHVAERVMDSNDLEREKGITILAKNTAVTYEGVKINILDTPGHADFGGEVERALRMVDGVILLVDAAEGPLPQTRFVMSKALALGLPAMVVINKIDRQDARPQEVLDEVYSLLIDLGGDEKLLELPVIYAVGREGKASLSLDVPGETLKPLFDAILEHVPAPKVNAEAPFQMLVNNLDYDDFVGRLIVGRIYAGKVRLNEQIAVMREGGKVEQGRVVKLYGFHGLKRVEIEQAEAGEVIMLAGIEDISIGDTLASLEKPAALERLHVDEPTMMMVFRVNDGPFAGKEGKYVTSRNLRDRLYREAYRNPAIKVRDTDKPEAFEVIGRGELQLAVIIETMRREGYELTASNPVPLTKVEDEQVFEPMEMLYCDVPDTSVGAVTERLGTRKGRMMDMQPMGSGRTRVKFRIPARGLIGFRNEFLTVTRGEGIMSSESDGWEPWQGAIPKRQSGSIVSDRDGETVAYSLFSLQERGTLFFGPGVPVYGGMVVGENAHPHDLEVNVTREKKLTNIRASGRDENVMLTPPREMGLEKALEWIAEDELVEVTPKSIRIRKRELDPHARSRAERDRKRGTA